MGAAAVAPASGCPVRAEPVTLHIYNVGKSFHVEAANRILRRLGTGAFHCGVEVYGQEYSFRGGNLPGSGVFWQSPRSNRLHSWVEAFQMGETPFQQTEVLSLVRRLRSDWQCARYDILKRNCCHFCDEFCLLLGVGAVPGWVTSLSEKGAALADGIGAARQVLDKATAMSVQVCYEMDSDSVCACSGCSLMAWPPAPAPARGTTVVVTSK